LTDSPVQNIDPISGLSKLETLDISFTGVTDITPLVGFVRLKGCKYQLPRAGFD